MSESSPEPTPKSSPNLLTKIVGFLSNFKANPIYATLRLAIIVLGAYLILTTGWGIAQKLIYEDVEIDKTPMPPVDYCVDRSRMQCIFSRAPDAVDFCTKEWSNSGQCKK